jgi:acyl-CoA reductase-like NAD-dependent aldehyde dehydrogenase
MTTQTSGPEVIERETIFVNGEWQRSSGVERITVINAATEEPFATIACCIAADVALAANAAASALGGWSESAVKDRIAVLIVPVGSESDPISIANHWLYGLAAGAWCADEEHARAIARQLRVGRVRINGSVVNRRASHGGFKLSGIGREWGRFGIEDFLEYQSVG